MYLTHPILVRLRQICIVPCVSLLSIAQLAAQERQVDYALPMSTIMLGAYGGVNLNWYQGTVDPSNGNSDCCSFRDGTGSGFLFGGKALFPVASNIFLRPALAFERIGGDFRHVRLSYPILGLQNNLEIVDLDNTLEISMSLLTVELIGGYSIVPEGIYLATGIAASFVLSNSYDHVERILRPEGVTYVDGRTSKNLPPNPGQLSSVLFSFRIGGGAMLPVDERLSVNPEMFFSFPMNDLNGTGWSVNGFQGSFAVFMRL